MAGLLRAKRIDDALRLRHDADNRPWVVAAVLGMLVLYLLLVTALPLHLGLPMPETALQNMGQHIDHVFDEDHNVESEIWIYHGNHRLHGDEQRLILILVVAAAFLSAYFLPLRHKRRALVFWFLIAASMLFGSGGVTGLLLAHGVIYLLFHTPSPRMGLLLPLGAGGLVPLVFGSGAVEWVTLSALSGWCLYWWGVPKLRARPKALKWVRTAAIQSALIVVLIGAVAEGIRGEAWVLPLGILLFFWQWERLIFYHLDHQKGEVPEHLPVSEYMAVFFSPGALSNWNWGVTIGQGYTYLHNNYLCEDKNRLAVEGIKIWAIALLYLVFGEWVRWFLVDGFSAWGLDVHQARVRYLVRDFVDDGQASTAEVLLTTLLDLMRWFFMWGAALHFKTGVWRVCGYRMDPYFNRPWLATNLVSLWGRFTFHYREFLVRAFFYPVFFRWFKTHTRLRLFVATMAAACFGNLAWGHIPEEMYYNGMRWENLGHVLETWPYFVLLGVGISLTELYLLAQRPTRTPWTRDRRLPLDLLAAYLTIQFYALIHIFFYPCDGGSLELYSRLFLIGLGMGGT